MVTGNGSNGSYYIENLSVVGLWGSQNLGVDFDERVNIIIGPNASGKTTLLNILRFVLTADFSSLYEIEFNEVKIGLRSFSGKGGRTLRVISTDEGLKLSVGRRIYPVNVELFEYHTSSVRRRLAERQRERLVELVGGLVPAVWLPVSRRLPMPEDEERDVRFRRRSMMESVDARLGELLEELATYRLKLDTQLTIRYKEFERSIFQLMLYDKQYDEFGLTSGEANVGEDKAHLLSAFQAAGLLDSAMKVRIDEHFSIAGEAGERIRKSKGGIDARDVFVIPLIRRTRSMISLARELENDRDAIFAPLRRYEGILKSFIKGKDIRVNDDGSIMTVDVNSSKLLRPNALSSGEKQIMILLTQALLMEDRPVVYVADEPELSLHVKWQAKLLSSLVELGGEIQIIVATHSPDIIGKYRRNVIDLEKQMR